MSQVKRDTTYDKIELKNGGAEARKTFDDAYHRNGAKNGSVAYVVLFGSYSFLINILYEEK